MTFKQIIILLIAADFLIAAYVILSTFLIKKRPGPDWPIYLLIVLLIAKAIVVAVYYFKTGNLKM